MESVWILRCFLPWYTIAMYQPKHLITTESIMLAPTSPPPHIKGTTNCIKYLESQLCFQDYGFIRLLQNVFFLIYKYKVVMLRCVWEILKIILFCRVQHAFKKTTTGYQYLSNHGVLFGDCSRGNWNAYCGHLISK